MLKINLYFFILTGHFYWISSNNIFVILFLQSLSQLNKIFLFFLFEFHMDLNKKITIWIKIMNLRSRRKFVPYRSFWDLLSLELNNFLQIKIVNVVNNPFDFKMCNIKFRCHGKKMYDLVSEEFGIILRVEFHYLISLILKVLQSIIAIIILAQTTHEHHYIKLGSFP